MQKTENFWCEDFSLRFNRCFSWETVEIFDVQTSTSRKLRNKSKSFKDDAIPPEPHIQCKLDSSLLIISSGEIMNN